VSELDPANDSADRGTSSLARLRALFDVAIDLDGEARAAWIAAHVADVSERDALERLLASADASARGFLDTPVGDHAGSLDIDDSVLAEKLLGQRIGAFRLVRLIGKGGMAAVFLGTREGGDFNQNVAIKLLRRGLYSELEQRLFLRERQLLASLDHPNIARLIDGGVSDAGLPFLVMEYVDGVPITHYAATHGLDVRARLGLFLTVCRAVEAAHRALIVHRDIKPSNILVAGDGTVKLLDFGIAKLLEDNIELGTVGIFTPDYAAPEQLAAQRVTTATDVYALGVLLHELLLGVRPGTNGATRRPSTLVMHDVTEQNAAAASALRRRLRGDLDNVIMKALAPEPPQRYASAGAFADDIERHLAGQPVAAHPPSRLYRARKFVARHRGSVLTTAALVLAIFAALGVALWQASVARKQSQVAHEEAERADTTRRFLIGVFDNVEPDANLGQAITAHQLLDQGERQLDVGSALPGGTRLDLTVLIARLYWDLGDYARAEPLLKRALDSAADAGASADVRARTLMTVADIEAQKHRYNDSLAHAKEALALAATAGRAGDDIASKARRLVAVSLHGQDNSKDAEPLLRDALAEDRALYGERSQAVLDDSLELGDELTELSRFDDAIALLRGALDLARDLHGPVHTNVAVALQELSGALGYAGKYAESETLQREALEVYAKVYGSEHTETMTARSNLFWTLEHEGHYEEALGGRRADIAILEQHPPLRLQLVATYYNTMGADLYKLGRLEEAETAIRKSLALFATLQGSNDEWDSADPMLNLGDLLRVEGKLDEAEATFRHALGIEEKHEPPTSGWLNRDRGSLAETLRASGRHDEALAMLKAANAARSGAKPDPIQCLLRARLALAELDAGDANAALATANESVAMARTVFLPGHFNLGTPLLALGRAELALGHAREADAAFREAIAARSPPFPADDLRVVEIEVDDVAALVALDRSDDASALRAKAASALDASPFPAAKPLKARLDAIGAKR
jgi:serine/threonine-protein kinase